MPALEHLGLGVLATLLATLRIYSWTAVGLALGTRKLHVGRAARTAVALLAGACLTILVYAPLAAAGHLLLGVVVDVLVVLWAAWRYSGDAARSLRDSGSLLMPRSRGGRIALTAVATLVWLVAIGPPRDGDVMHYHLAHVRQIIASGGWMQIPVCSYGIPFGWSLTYLPFEWIGVPQAAHLLNLGAWMLTSALAIEVARSTSDARAGLNEGAARCMLLGATLLPFVLKAATTAMADAFTMLAVAATVTLLAGLPRLDRNGALALGFAAFAALTTRYQGMAIAIPVTVIVLAGAVRQKERRPLLGSYAAGASIALIAASPFYIANAMTLGAMFWPFGLARSFSVPGIIQPTDDFAQIATVCASRALSGEWHDRLAAAGRLLLDSGAFPIPLFLLIGSAATFLVPRCPLRRVATFVLLFFGIWAVAQPRLEPRFSVYLVYAAIVLAVPLASGLWRTPLAPAARIAAGVAFGTVSIAAVLYSWDYLRLAATGDVARFHQATWYWPAYDWANRNTPKSSRYVVVLYGGNTYPLDRWNVSGDPGSSAAVPWARLKNGCDLAAFLRSARANFVFYGPNVWTNEPMNDRVARAVAEAAAARTLDTVRTFDVPIVYGRMEGLARNTTVVLYRVDAAWAAAECARR